jgi:hypothetical protein
MTPEQSDAAKAVAERRVAQWCVDPKSTEASRIRLAFMSGARWAFNNPNGYHELGDPPPELMVKAHEGWVRFENMHRSSPQPDKYSIKARLTGKTRVPEEGEWYLDKYQNLVRRAKAGMTEEVPTATVVVVRTEATAAHDGMAVM